MEVKTEGVPRNTAFNLAILASLVSGFLLLGTGFLAGWYWQNASVQDVVTVAIVEKSGKTEPNAAGVLGTETEAKAPAASGCQFVGSKNSDKYHSPDSGSAKRIKPENLVCFHSEQEALDAGYEAGTL